jgi:predicted enzyme related to lactoylglutathione lyase
MVRLDLYQWGTKGVKPLPNSAVHFDGIGGSQQLLEGLDKAVFGWKITPGMECHLLLDTMSKSGSGIRGGIGAGEESRRHLTFYLSVADINAALAAIETKGEKKGSGPHPIRDGGRIAGFLDPEKHLIGLVQPPSGNVRLRARPQSQ